MIIHDEGTRLRRIAWAAIALCSGLDTLDDLRPMSARQIKVAVFAIEAIVDANCGGNQDLVVALASLRDALLDLMRYPVEQIGGHKAWLRVSAALLLFEGDNFHLFPCDMNKRARGGGPP